MKFGLSPSLVKNSLAGHSWIGLMIGLPMYLICLSGTLAVFFLEFERWEQPAAAEYESVDPARIDAAYESLMARATAETEHAYVQLPRGDMPRTVVSTDTEGWFVNPDGTLSEPVAHDWTHFLLNLHLYLHLPTSFGMIVVSALGALLCGLIISGFLAHPRIFRDAFNLRLKGSRHLEQADIHNRLSVWGAPFHLMIAVTGAYFGLAALMTVIFASAYFDGDRTAVIGAVFGEEPQLSQTVAPAAVGTALAKTREIAPEATPFYITVEEVGTPEQYIIVGAEHPGRLIYGEQYRFDSQGTYLDKAGFSDGEAGQQAIFSVYRVHFGHFGGFPVKILYGIFGLALTVVSVTGINIWLARRKRQDWLNTVWTGLVWGTPAALALSALAGVVFGLPPVPVFWIGLVASGGAVQWLNDEQRGKAGLQAATGILLIALLIGHLARFSMAALGPAALGVNGAIGLTALLMLYMAARRKEILVKGSPASRMPT